MENNVLCDTNAHYISYRNKNYPGNSVLIGMLIAIHMRMSVTSFTKDTLKTWILHNLVIHIMHAAITMSK